MSRVRALAGLARRLPTVWRTVRPLRGEQLLAQLRHAIVGVGAPCTVGGATPTRAISAPPTPFLAPPAHVRALGADRFELLATPFSIPRGAAWLAPPGSPLFAYHLHQHDWLRCPEVSPTARAEVLRDWLATVSAGAAWDPHPTGLRLVTWGKLLATPGSLPPESALEERLLRSFADHAETLSRHLEIRLQANHLLSNLLCVAFAALFVDCAATARWRARAPLLVAELGRQIHADGGHEERSPMYHAALLEQVLDVLNLCRAKPEHAPAGLELVLAEAAERMLAALDRLCLGDGRIALFGDSGFDVAPEPSALWDYGRRLGLPLAAPTRAGSAVLAQTGYVRLVAGEWCLLASVAGPSPAHQPGHAHCDALAFELSLGTRRLVGDTGNFEYVVGPRRRQARATASHATLAIDGEEQAETWSAHRVGGRPQVALTTSAEDHAEAVCAGWSRPATRHRRRFEVADACVVVVDTVEGPTRHVRAALPIDPGFAVELAPRTSGALALCRANDGSGVRVEIDLPAELGWRIERGAYYPSFGRELERAVLVGEGSSCRGARTRFRRTS